MFAFNYKDGTKAVTITESEEELSSDLEGATPPPFMTKKERSVRSFFFLKFFRYLT